MHNRVEIVWYTIISRGKLFEVPMKPGTDIVEVYVEEVVSIVALMFMPQSQHVTQFVEGVTELQARTKS